MKKLITIFTNNHIKKLVSLIFIIGVLVVIITNAQPVKPTTVSGFFFDTYINITIYDKISEKDKDTLVSLFYYYDNILSPTYEDSLCDKLNKNDTYVIEENSYELITTAFDIAKETNGIVDPTIMSVYELYSFSPDNSISPNNDDIENALTHVDYSSIHIENGILSKNDSESKITLGFIAKGFIADKIAEHLHSIGINNALVNLGGNVLAMGSKNNVSGSTYTIAIQNPFDSLPSIYNDYQYDPDIAKYINTLSSDTVSNIYDDDATLIQHINDQSVVTSGIYERYYMDENTVMHHLLDTTTGKPADNELVSVSIIGPSSMYCDAYSTTCFLLGLQKGTDFLEKHPEYKGIFITKKGDIIKTK